MWSFCVVVMFTTLFINSISIYSSLVILVKKEDSIWKMCIDYCALNWVKEKLNLGIIWHNASVYSSLVILVKKEGSIWKMCINYCTLNWVTIKFPIHVVDELLDEFHRTCFFSMCDFMSCSWIYLDMNRIVKYSEHKTCKEAPSSSIF